MARLLFLDPACSHPYQSRTLFDRAMEDPEASVIRVAEGLAQRGHRVTVAQRGRAWPARSPAGVAFVPFDYAGGWGHLPRADAAVVLGQHKVLPKVRKRLPDARLALWLHDVPGTRRCRTLGPLATDAGAAVVCVSDAHQGALREALQAVNGWARTARVHLPVDDALSPDGTPVDPDKLVALAGAGLDEVLAAYAEVRALRPRARLYVAGAPWPVALPPGVIPLGPLPHREILRHVREAFAVFQPQAVHEPTAARALAEAAAVGTPVLAHPHAAIREALAEAPGDRRQLVDARDPAAAARRLRQWWEEGRPEVACPPHLRTTRVVADWERLLGVTSTRPRALRTLAPTAGRSVAAAA